MANVFMTGASGSIGSRLVLVRLTASIDVTLNPWMRDIDIMMLIC